MSTVESVRVATADVAPNTRHGAELRVLISPRTVGAANGLFGVATLKAHEHIREHYHPYSEESLYVVRGQVTVRLDGEPLAMRPGDAVLIRKHVRHRVDETGGGEAVIVFAHAGLAPRPDMGHVVTEEAAAEELPQT